MLKDTFVNGNGGWVGAVARLGLPIVLSLLLTTFLIFKVDTALGQVGKSASTNTELIQAAAKQMTGFRDSQEMNLRIIRRLSLQTCRNTARTAAQLQLCEIAAEE